MANFFDRVKTFDEYIDKIHEMANPDRMQINEWMESFEVFITERSPPNGLDFKSSTGERDLHKGLKVYLYPIYL